MMTFMTLRSRSGVVYVINRVKAAIMCVDALLSSWKYSPVYMHGCVQALRPELRIMTRGAVDISGDALPIFGYEHYTANDYRLDFVTITPPPVPVPVPVSGGTSSSSAAAGSAAGTPSAAAGAKEPSKAAPVAGSGASNAGSAAQSSQVLPVHSHVFTYMGSFYRYLSLICM